MRQLTLVSATLVAGASLLPAAATARPSDLDRSRSTPGEAAKTLSGAASGAAHPGKIPRRGRDGDVVFVVVDSPAQRSRLPGLMRPSLAPSPTLQPAAAG